MKLSLERKLGWLHVRAGRVVRVTTDHQVPTGTQNARDDDGGRLKPFSGKWVTAVVGDLAVELVAVKTGNVIGYSYISGPAMQLNLYRADAPGCIASRSARRSHLSYDCGRVRGCSSPSDRASRPVKSVSAATSTLGSRRSWGGRPMSEWLEEQVALHGTLPEAQS